MDSTIPAQTSANLIFPSLGKIVSRLSRMLEIASGFGLGFSTLISTKLDRIHHLAPHLTLDGMRLIEEETYLQTNL